MPDGEPSPTGHWRVADKTGKNIVIEIINHGELHVYDNIGVVTNSPDYPWQLTNLGNYVNIESGTISSKNFGSYTAKALGAGTSSIGLPGDITPPSRFVRAAFFLFNSPIYDNASETVGEAFHILNNFDIPIGIEFGPDQRSHIPDLPSATQWTTAIDLSNSKFYYKTMYESSVQFVDVSESVNAISTEETFALDSGKFKPVKKNPAK